GQICALPAVMGVYRRHAGGVWGGQATARRVAWTAAMYRAVNRHLGYRYNGLITRRLFDLHHTPAWGQLAPGETGLAWTQARACLGATWQGRRPDPRLGKLLLRLVAPGAYQRIRRGRKRTADA